MTIIPRSEGIATITVAVSDGSERVKRHFDLEVTTDGKPEMPDTSP